MLDPRRLRRWMGRVPISRVPESCPVAKTAPGASQRAVSAHEPPETLVSELTSASLADRPPIARTLPHRLTEAEREEILRAADEQGLAHLRHRKLCHQLSREGRVYCSESSVLRVLRAAGKVPRYIRRHRPERPRSQDRASKPNTCWDYDLTEFPTLAGPYFLVPVLDRCSRKIVGRYFGPEAVSASVQTAWGKSLADEGLLAEEGPELPDAHSDRGTQMTSRSTQSFFADLGIAQTFSRPRTPTDNASCESWMATLKCERLYEADTAEMTPEEVESMIDRFIDYYNNERLHQAFSSSHRPTGTRDVMSRSSRQGRRGCAGHESRGRWRRTEGPGKSGKRGNFLTDSGQRVWRGPPGS